MSGDILTGSETSTAALIGEQTQQAHRVFIAAGSFSQSTAAKFIHLPIYDRGLARRLSNILALRRILLKESIDLVHAHSRAASWVSYWACRWTKTAFLSTLHGRQHTHFTSRRFNVYGPLCIAVCENICDQMMDHTNFSKPKEIVIIRNGIYLK